MNDKEVIKNISYCRNQKNIAQKGLAKSRIEQKIHTALNQKYSL